MQDVEWPEALYPTFQVEYVDVLQYFPKYDFYLNVSKIKIAILSEWDTFLFRW